MCGAEASREQFSKKASQGRQTNTQDADKGFEDGPVCGCNVVICWVCGCCKLHQGLETDYRHDCGAMSKFSSALYRQLRKHYLQGPEAKHHDDVDLLLRAQRQAQKLGNRNPDYHNIQGDVDGSMHPSEDMKVDARPRMLPIPACPDVRYGCTVEDAGDDE